MCQSATKKNASCSSWSFLMLRMLPNQWPTWRGPVGR
jgi:hypothetical protein